MAQASIPRFTRDVIYEIQRSREMNAGIKAMMERKSDFGNDSLRATLAGISMIPAARAHLDATLDERWSRSAPPDLYRKTWPEVVVGAGLHAAIYCAVRVANGHPRPLVLEGSDRVGGAFACSSSPAFYLNSRNKPGNLGFPGRPGALNFLPASPIQPSDLSGAEYQRNTDLAYIIRILLAMNAIVVTDHEVTAADLNLRTVKRLLTRPSRPVINANRVLFAIGIGKPINTGFDNPRILTFEALMKRMDDPFPLRGLRNVAVIGAGDGGKTVIEALVGQGPGEHWSVKSIDYLERIDWYSQKLISQDDRVTWEQCNRGRYKAIGKLFQSTLVKPIPRNVPNSSIASGYDAAYVEGVPYDLVVDCRGYTKSAILDSYSTEWKIVGGRKVGQVVTGFETYRIGPFSDIPFGEGEKVNAINKIPENQTALFRYADRTAALAASLT